MKARTPANDAKQEQKATRDLKKTIATPRLENLKVRTDLEPILEPFWVPKSMENRIEISVENRTPKNRAKASPTGAPATINPCTSGAQGSLGVRGNQ